jgi:5-methylcytosine-specific restriction endonuclease McrA
MPIDYNNYPPDWQERRERILTRAGGLCERCHAKNYSTGRDGFRVVLAVAHLDHDPENWEVSDERLLALCQRCHLNNDRPENIKKIKYGRHYEKLQYRLPL